MSDLSKEFTGRVTWLEEEMLFHYCSEHRVWEKEVNGRTAVVDREMLGTRLTLGCFQRSVMIAVQRTLKEKS
jgi:hypothetical protein